MSDIEKLIPPPEVVRVELARAVREAKRLRSLLQLANAATEDRHIVGELRQQSAVAVRGGGRG